jgi:hypothetical protein
MRTSWSGSKPTLVRTAIPEPRSSGACCPARGPSRSAPLGRRREPDHRMPSEVARLTADEREVTPSFM